MNPNWAAENLQTIRTLMERSALYRRALAPITLFAGVIGLLTAGIGLGCQMESPRAFAGLWLGAACVAVVGSFLLARRQAGEAQEPFWSPPTRRVAQALLPPLLCGLFVSLILASLDANWAVNLPIVLTWMLFYGCALHSAGFFMARGIRWFGWVFIICALGIPGLLHFCDISPQPATANLLMGAFFGGLHLAYGIYLYFTEPKNSVA